MSSDRAQTDVFDRHIDHCELNSIALSALMLSRATFDQLKREIPRKEYRKRHGTQFTNEYRGVPIEIHDEWSWGWMLRAADNSYFNLPAGAR
jgi:hypothetical protein